MHSTQVSTMGTAQTVLGLFILATFPSAQGPVLRNPVQVDSAPLGSVEGTVLHADGSRVAIAYLDGGATGPQSIQVAVSTNGGVTFGLPLRVDNDATGSDKQLGRDSLRVSGDRIYVLWRDTRLGTDTDNLYFNYSEDGGLTYQVSDRRLGDGAAGSNEVFDWRFVIRQEASGDDLYVLETAEIVSGNGNEELFLLSSLDGGVNWANAIDVGGDDALGIDVDQFALAVSGTRVHMAWENGNQSSGLNDVLYQQTDDAGLTFLPLPIPLDSSDSSGTGNSASSSDTGLSLAVENDLVLAAWPEERTSGSNEELRVAVSTNGGTSWTADQRIGGYDPVTDDIDSCSTLVAGGLPIVAWDDNRDQAGFNKLYVAVSTNSGTTFSETEVSGDLGGTVPRLSGAGSNLVLFYTSHSGSLDRAAGVYSIDSGMTWSDELALSDNSASDSDGTDGLFVDDSENALVLYRNDASGVNGVFTGGFSLCNDGLSVGRNAGSNPVSLTADIPLLGNDWMASVDLGTTGHGFAVILGYRTPLNFVLGGGQVLLVNIADPGGEALNLPIVGGNPAQVSRTLPNFPDLCGETLSIQALHFGSILPFALSNAIDLDIASF